MVEPIPAISITDTDTHPIIHGNPYIFVVYTTEETLSLYLNVIIFFEPMRFRNNLRLRMPFKLLTFCQVLSLNYLGCRAF